MVRTAKEAVNHLWEKEFFEEERTRSDIKKKMSSIKCHPPESSLTKALRDAKFIGTKGKRGKLRYIQRHAASPVHSEELFSTSLKKQLGSRFETDVRDLEHNYGVNGTCTAFLLRKILEKLIFFVFTKHGRTSDIEDAEGNFLGLKAILTKASTTKINHTPMLLPKTAKAINGIKFLGDTSAHNPLTNVEMKTITPQMPFIITAYQELATHL